MAFNDKKRFWIIFDTCTRPEYYQDVHNLLALPKGATIRYEYRNKYLSSSALEAASNTESAPSEILLVYAQWEKYHKGDASPKPPPPSSEIFWISTRLAEMRSISQDNENFFFDIKISGYPKSDSDALLKILTPLIKIDEVPFHNWICLSSDLVNLNILQGGKEDKNWQSIIDRLGSMPSQFAGDLFWRMRGPFLTDKGYLSTIDPKYHEDMQVVDGGVEVRKVSSFYEVCENDPCSIEVISHSPHQTKNWKFDPPRSLNIEVDKDGPLLIEGDTKVDLRQYTANYFRIRAKRSEGIDEKIGTIKFHSNQQATQWPIGPNITLGFKVRKSNLKTIMSIIGVVVGAVCVIIVPKLWDQEPILSALVGGVGILLILLSFLQLTGKISFKT